MSSFPDAASPEVFPSSPSAVAKCKAARLMAVQAVYQMQVNEQKEAAFVVEEYLVLRKGMEVDGTEMVKPNDTLFRKIVTGVSERLEDLSGIVEANRPRKEESKPAREPLLEAIFLCGAYELLAHGDIDFPVVISSYVDVTKAFYSGNESALVNAVLDSIRKVCR